MKSGVTNIKMKVPFILAQNKKSMEKVGNLIQEPNVYKMKE